MDIQWYPGHMTKTRRQIQADLKLVDLVAEIIDARIPISSRNPDIDELVGEKPRLIVLNRADQADPAMNKVWGDWFRSRGWWVLETNARDGKGVSQFSAAIRSALKEKIEQWKAKGLVGRPVRAMVVGVPNVGKSTFINQVAKKKSAKAGNRPGVTRGKQWVNVDPGLDLLDTPGILWPKFEDETTGMHLAFTGAVKDEIMDLETLACHLMEILGQRYPQALVDRYKVELEPELPGWELLERCGRKRGFLISGGEVDTERMSRVLLEEYRSGKLGNFTLESPEELEGACWEEGYQAVCGCDEAGAGPLSGALYAAAVLLPREAHLSGLNDSKKLTPKKRELLYDQIRDQAVAWAVTRVEPEEIDATDILSARMKAMQQAIDALSPAPDLALVDGNRDHGRAAAITSPHRTVVKGDSLSASIAAASILAKVSRDRYMEEMAQMYPQYEFERHKGYPTRRHYELLRQYGPCPIHRRSFLSKL